MICGALQTLNEEACEDVLDENVDPALVDLTDIPQTTLIPPSPDQLPQQLPGEHSGHTIPPVYLERRASTVEPSITHAANHVIIIEHEKPA